MEYPGNKAVNSCANPKPVRRSYKAEIECDSEVWKFEYLTNIGQLEHNGLRRDVIQLCGIVRIDRKGRGWEAFLSYFPEISCDDMMPEPWQVKLTRRPSDGSKIQAKSQF